MDHVFEQKNWQTRFNQTIQSCIEALSYSRAAAFGQTAHYPNTPLCPLIHVFWDGMPDAGRELVRSVFADLWPSGAYMGDLVAFMEGSTDQQRLRLDLVNSATPLRQNQQIREANNVHVVHYLCLSSPDFWKQAEAIRDLHTRPISGLSNSIYPLVFCFCDLDITRMNESHTMLWKLHHDYLKPVPQLREIFLGEELMDGSLLKKDQADENFRIAADVAFLASTVPGANNEPYGLRAWLARHDPADDTAVTAAYQLMQKPSKRIALVTLTRLLDMRAELARKTAEELTDRGAQLSATQFFDALGINVGRLEQLERAFQEYVRPLLPGPESFEPVINWKKASKKKDYAGANQETGGALDLFVARNFCSRAEQLDFDGKALAEEIVRDFLKKTDYLFAVRHFAACAEYMDALRPSPHSGVYENAVAQAKARFYRRMVPLLKEAMLDCAGDAERFSRQLQTFRQHLTVPPELPRQGLRSVDEFYLMQASRTARPDMLIETIRPGSSEDDIYEGLKTAFQNLVQQDPEIYRASLEQEIKHRTETDEHGMAPDEIQTQLDMELGNKQRMKVMQMEEESRGYYLFYGDAEFGARLKQETGRVKTECEDRAERLELYRFSVDSLMGREAQ